MADTPNTSRFTRISPMLSVANMEVTLGFYQNVLGFQITSESPSYSVMERDGLTIHFMLAAKEDVLRVVHGHPKVYMEVEAIQPLWAHVQTFKERYKIHDLFSRDDQAMEFHIGDPNGCMVIIVQKPAS